MEKCLITIRDKKIKIMVEADITEMGFKNKWDLIRDLIARYCTLGQKLESIIFFEDERIIGGIRPGKLEY